MEERCLWEGLVEKVGVDGVGVFVKKGGCEGLEGGRGLWGV